MTISLFYKYLYLISFLYLCYSFGTLSINTATTIPPNVQQMLNEANISEVRIALNGTRRIVGGDKVLESRHYMVYLKLPRTSSKYKEYRQWLCGGVIIHEEYILTSAACIEDARHFYVVSGTYRYDAEDDHYNNLCIKNGAKKAIWKCIPRNYVFDGHENDNIRWMNNDIAIVKVEDEFDFTRQIRGCDFIPQPIRYNNHSKQLENPGTDGTIVGWGSTLKYSDFINTRAQAFSQDLLEANVQVISKKYCKRRWGRRYHNIIDNYMICTKDNGPELSSLCQNWTKWDHTGGFQIKKESSTSIHPDECSEEKYVDCTDIMYSQESLEGGEKRRVLAPKDLVLHSAYHNTSTRRGDTGGFCENDHGGPLVYGSGVNAIVIGIISACLVKEKTNICYGPFLYTSVYKNRMLITCAIYKDTGGDCNKLFRSRETHDETELSWIGHPDGPAKNELNKTRRGEERKKHNATVLKVSDTIVKHEGIVLRAANHT